MRALPLADALDPSSVRCVHPQQQSFSPQPHTPSACVRALYALRSLTHALMMAQGLPSLVEPPRRGRASRAKTSRRDPYLRCKMPSTTFRHVAMSAVKGEWREGGVVCVSHVRRMARGPGATIGKQMSGTCVMIDIRMSMSGQQDKQSAQHRTHEPHYAGLISATPSPTPLPRAPCCHK